MDNSSPVRIIFKSPPSLPMNSRKRNLQNPFDGNSVRLQPATPFTILSFASRRARKRLNGERRPKTVVPRPMIQGAPEALCIGEDGSQYVGGSFSGNKDFDTGPGFDFHESIGAEDGFVTRFDRDGKYCWTKTFGAKERVDVRGIAVSRGVVYAVCEELEGHVAIVAMDCATGASKAGFGHSGCQMFRCGQFDFAAGIRSRGDTIYVAIRCRNILAGKLPPLVAGEPAPGDRMARLLVYGRVSDRWH